MKYAAALAVMLPLSAAASRLRVQAPAPSPASAPAPGPAGLPALAVTFEIANYNYIDLDKALEVPPKRKNRASKRHHDGDDGVERDVSNVWHGITRYAESLGDDIAGTSNDVADATHETVHHNANHVADGVNSASLKANENTKRATDHAHRNVRAGTDGAHNHFKAGVDKAHGGVVHGSEVVRARTRRSDDGSSLGQVDADVFLRLEPLVRDVLRDTVRDTVDDIIEEYLSRVEAAAAPAAATAAAPAAALLGTNASSAPPPAAPVNKVDVFVQFSPGRTRPIFDTQSSGVFFQSYPNMYHYDDTQHPDNGKTTMVEVTITGTPQTGADELPLVEKALGAAEASGELQAWLAAALYEVSGLVPRIDEFTLGMTNVAQWSAEACETHMAKVVKRFVMAYTRRMVPTAIYNECTNYVPLMSFSHDYIPNPYDTNKCRDATIKFVKKWNFGKAEKKSAAGPAPAPAAASPAPAPATAAQFGEFCLDACEAKYGFGAQQCHVTEGDQLLLKAP